MISSTSEIHKYLTEKRKEYEEFSKSVDRSVVSEHNLSYVQSEDAKGMKELKRNILIKDQAKIAKILKENPEIINTVLDEKGYCALHFAVVSLGEDGLDVIKLLLRNGASPHSKDNEGNKPVDLLDYNTQNREIDDFLRDVMEYPYKIFEDEVPPLSKLISHPQVESVLPAQRDRTELDGRKKHGDYSQLSESNAYDQRRGGNIETPLLWNECLANRVFEYLKQSKTTFLRRWYSNERLVNCTQFVGPKSWN
jgi:hypothetical protein